MLYTFLLTMLVSGSAPALDAHQIIRNLEARYHRATTLKAQFFESYTDGKGGGFYLTGEFVDLVPFSRIVHVERMHLPNPCPDNHVETRFEPDGAGMLMTMRMTLPDAETRAAMLATGMEHGMEASYVRLETMI